MPEAGSGVTAGLVPLGEWTLDLGHHKGMVARPILKQTCREPSLLLQRGAVARRMAGHGLSQGRREQARSWKDRTDHDHMDTQG